MAKRDNIVLSKIRRYSVMSMKIMWFGAIFLGGWLWAYLFIRQFLFNFLVAKPLIGKMKATDKELIAPGAEKYSVVSYIICVFFLLLGTAVVLIFGKTHIIIGYLVGLVSGAVMVYGKMKPSNREMFDSFCVTYYRFVPDDELRTAMFNKKPSRMKLRLHDMGLSTAFIPSFMED